MLSPYRIPPTSNTLTGKQKTSNHTEHDLKMTSIDQRMTSNDLKMTSGETVEYEKNKLRGGGPNNNPTQGVFLLNKFFLLRKMAVFFEIIEKIRRLKINHHKPLKIITKNHIGHNQKYGRMLQSKVESVNKQKKIGRYY